MAGEVRHAPNLFAVVEQNLLDETHPVPTLLLLPKHAEPFPVVVGVAQQGKSVFLKQRADAIARLLEKGVAVCLVDVRGTSGPTIWPLPTALAYSRANRRKPATATTSARFIAGTFMQRSRSGTASTSILIRNTARLSPRISFAAGRRRR